MDLYGRVGLYIGKGNVAAGSAEVMDFLSDTELSDASRSIFPRPAEIPPAIRIFIKVFCKGDLPVKAHLESGVYHLEIPFDRQNKI